MKYIVKKHKIYKIRYDTYNEALEHIVKLKNLDADQDNSDWCISRIGYADSYDEAWNEAKEFYEKYKKRGE